MYRTRDMEGDPMTSARGTRRSNRDTGDGETAVPPPESPETGDGGGDQNFVRVTVNLTPNAYRDLQRVSAVHHLGKTDVINRALQVYALVERLLAEGDGKLTIVNSDGQHEKIYII
jgi:hypothetical protein